MRKKVLRVKFRLGLFEKPYTDESKESVLLAKEHLAVAAIGSAVGRDVEKL